MKLDATDLRYILPEEFRILKAVEQGSRAHHVVPASVIAHLSGLQHSGLNKVMGSLAKRNLIAREQNIKYDGYRLTYGGYDYLAVRALKEKDHVQAVGQRVGVGKESDIYIVSAGQPDYENRILKIHRLGRVSFRAVKEKREYTNKNANRQNFSWMFLSRLAAAKEFQFMQALHEHGFPVPIPYGQSRHSVVMSLIDAYPLRQILELPKDQIPLLYSALMSLIVRLGKAGLIHGDFNEFNLLIREKRSEEEEEHEEIHDPFKQYPSAGPFGQKVGTEPPPKLQEGEEWQEGNGFARVVASSSSKRGDVVSAPSDDEDTSAEEEEGSDDGSAEETHDDKPIRLSDGATVEPILIDFPQMVSVLHPNADYYFDRDVQCVRRFFKRRFRYISSDFPKFSEVLREGNVKEWIGQRREREKRRERLGFRVSPLDQDDKTDDGQNSDLAVYLDLDVLTKASGYSSEVEKRGEYEELNQYMSRLRVEGISDGGDDDGGSLSEDEEETEIDEEQQEPRTEQDDDDDDDDTEQEEGSPVKGTTDQVPSSHEAHPPPASTNCKSRRQVPSRKAIEEGSGNPTTPTATTTTTTTIAKSKEVTQRIIANERSALKKQALKSSSKGKIGRTHAGGKAKGESVKDAAVF